MSNDEITIRVSCNGDKIEITSVQFGDAEPLTRASGQLKRDNLTIEGVKLLEIFESVGGRRCVHNPYTCELWCFP